MTPHSRTPGAINAARIILNGKGSIMTRFGIKMETGVADLIDRETHAWAIPQLVKALVQAVNVLRHDYPSASVEPAIKQAQAALAVVEERTP